MPAKNLSRVDGEGTYSHIYNKGVEQRTIFNEKEDYEVFLGFLKDYLTAPQDPESIKKDFSVHGRIFRGTPHQPKNYFNKVELVAYSLMPDHFHLLLHQITQASMEGLIRSLCTRYSMYFNKKYQHTGALFEGPYKSVHIKDELHLLHLTRYLHHTGDYSSYPEYLGAKETSWVKPKVVQSFFDKVKTDLFKGTDSYKDFMERYELDQKEKALIAGIIFEDETQHLKRRDLASPIANSVFDIAPEAFAQIDHDSNLKPLQRIPEFIATTIVFVLLLTLGVRNIMISTPTNPKPSSLGIHTVVSTPESPKPSSPAAMLSTTTAVEKIQPKIILTIKIDDASASASVNIRQKPATNSKKIGQAKNGDTFEFLSEDSEWYEVKLITGSTGFISTKYGVLGRANNE